MAGRESIFPCIRDPDQEVNVNGIESRAFKCGFRIRKKRWWHEPYNLCGLKEGTCDREVSGPQEALSPIQVRS